MPRIHYNAPSVLTFSLLAIVFCLINAEVWCAVPGRGNFSFTRPMDYFRLFTHVLGHAGWPHLLGNLTFMIFATALATGFANILISPNHLVGASGVVFMLIILASIVDFRKGTIPLSFLLIALIFIGKEVSDALSKDDNVSQLAHIVGGLVGAFFGFRLKK